MPNKAKRALLATATITSALAVSSTSNLALADVCVTCAAPDAAYACVIQGAALPPDDARAKLLCITELAKSGGHQSCAVSRAVTAPCPGEVRTVVAPSGDAPVGAPAEPADAPPQPAAPPGERTTTTVPKSAPPSDVGSSADKTGAAETTDGDGAFEKAGKAVTDAAKSTWKCLSSFFGDC